MWHKYIYRHTSEWLCVKFQTNTIKQKLQESFYSYILIKIYEYFCFPVHIKFIFALYLRSIKCGIVLCLKNYTSLNLKKDLIAKKC